jgi:hypothetical protein
VVVVEFAAEVAEVGVVALLDGVVVALVVFAVVFTLVLVLFVFELVVEIEVGVEARGEGLLTRLEVFSLTAVLILISGED